MSSPYLEAAAQAERERDEALYELAAVKSWRSDMKRQLKKALEDKVRLCAENKKLTAEVNSYRERISGV